MNAPAFVTPEIVRQVTDTIARAVNPEKIIVFGSFARNESEWDSDLDLLVVMDTNLPFVERALKIRGLFDCVPCPMDVVVYTPDEIAHWRDIPSSFIHQILSEGRLLYDRTAEAVGQTVGSQS